MKSTTKTSNKCILLAVKAAAAAVTLAAAGAASAQTAGTWMFKAGYNRIMPKVASGDLSQPSRPNSEIDVKSASSLILTGAYMFTDHVSAELFLGRPYEHDLKGAGAIAAAGKIGSVKQLPPTLLAQYRFRDPKASFRPYVGRVVTYAMFRHEQGSPTLDAMMHTRTSLSVDSAWGATAELGATYSLGEKWLLSASVHKTYIKTTAHLSTGHTIDARLDPVSANFSIVYLY